MARERQIFFDETLRGGMSGNEPDLVALAFDPKMHDALAALQILYPQTAEFFAPDAVIEQGSDDGAVAFACEGVVRWRLECGRLRLFSFIGDLEKRDRRPLILYAGKRQLRNERNRP